MLSKSLRVLAFSNNELITALLIIAHRQGRIQEDLWDDLCDDELMGQFKYEISHQNDLHRLEIFRVGDDK